MASNGDRASTPAKRTRNDVEAEDLAPEPITDREDASSSEDDGVGPALPSSAPPKKKRRRHLPHEALYLAALPAGTRYSKSLMHKAVCSFVTFTPRTDFLITAGADGQVSFWKKGGTKDDVEFVKEFKAHQGEIKSVAVSWNGASFASAGADGTVKVWDVVSFDLVAVITVKNTPTSICWVHGRGGGIPMLAVGNELDGEIDIYDGRGDSKEALKTLMHIHKKPVTSMAYNVEYDCVVSADEGGMIEYWQPNGQWSKPENVFKLKSDTNLFEFKKAKSTPTSITLSPTGNQFATFSFPDRKVRVFDFASGKLFRTYDESLTAITDMQQAGTAFVHLEDVEFGRRLAVERELDNASTRNHINVQFDETGNFILYGSILGIKVINTLTNKLLKVFGKDEPFRSLNLAMYQGQPEKKGVVTVQMAASDNPLLQEAEERDAILVSTGSGKVRFYMFTNEQEVSKANRDVQNEKPRNVTENTTALAKKQAATGSAATVHTTYGDIQIRLFPDAAPKTVENFVTHSRNGYYNNVIFHRVIRKFMIQTGDPLGDGTGGESIWGKEFEDEFRSGLKHDKPYTVSMANAGPNTNGSQFFITTEKTPWLDNKHTIFGRAVQGLDVIHRIENTRVHKEKPQEDIKIVNISIT